MRFLRLGPLGLGRVLLVLVLIRHGGGGGLVGDWACAIAAATLKGSIVFFELHTCC